MGIQYLKIITFICIAMWLFYIILIRNPLNAWYNTQNKDFTKKVFINQFKMNEYEFAHWLNKPF